MKLHIKILRWIWEFPQCLLGILFIGWYNVTYKETFNGIKIYAGKFPGGISLGLYILMDETSWKYNRGQIKEHEYGHTRQSLKWGWLYLPTVGLCSVGWNVLRKMSSKLRSKSYYSVWPESEADALGGVNR